MIWLKLFLPPTIALILFWNWLMAVVSLLNTQNDLAVDLGIILASLLGATIIASTFAYNKYVDNLMSELENPDEFKDQ